MGRIDRIAQEFDRHAGDVTISSGDLAYLIEIAQAASKAHHLLTFGDDRGRHEAGELLSRAIDKVDGPLSQDVRSKLELILGSVSADDMGSVTATRAVFSRANVWEGQRFYRDSDSAYFIVQDDIDDLGVTLKQVKPWNGEDMLKYEAIDWADLNSGAYVRGWNNY
jgi:hypothetical protein